MENIGGVVSRRDVNTMSKKELKEEVLSSREEFIKLHKKATRIELENKINLERHINILSELYEAKQKQLVKWYKDRLKRQLELLKAQI